MSAAGTHRRAPRPLGLALDALTAKLAPPTTLARIQSAWPAAVGEAVARAGQPVAERDGLLTVQCVASVWANELTLMGPDVVARLNEALGAEIVTGLRCRTA